MASLKRSKYFKKNNTVTEVRIKLNRYLHKRLKFSNTANKSHFVDDVTGCERCSCTSPFFSITQNLPENFTLTASVNDNLLTNDIYNKTKELMPSRKCHQLLSDCSDDLLAGIKIENISKKHALVSRRPGTVYKQNVAEKMKDLKSEYFINNGQCKQKHWTPPRSPYRLIQEDLYHSPWQLLIATIFLTKTQAKKAIPQILKFLERWPTPYSLLAARQEEIVELLAPLGIQHIRSATIRRFTAEFLGKNWSYPEELYGIGKYGNDSYRIFCVNEWKSVIPNDKKLNLYKNWLIENRVKLGI